jgi:hypothetical protein
MELGLLTGVRRKRVWKFDERHRMLTDSWHFLTQDVSIAGGFQSPMLSWLGAAGILALCAWHSVSLLRAVLHLRQAFRRILAGLAPLIRARQQARKEWLVLPSLAKKQALAPSTAARRDLDDLQALDRILRAEPAVAAEWLSYRKTFTVEQPSWFLEPTVSAGRSAADFFSFDSISGNCLNVRFYQQLPAFMTGIGLMFTFLAILIGLSKLHANGSQIDGMQGLINGLAGKFVTSIVGLACANGFTLLEKSLWHRLSRHHRAVISLLDEMFPQQVQNQSTRESAASVDRTVVLAGGIRNDSGMQLVDAVQQRLGSTVAALTTVSESLAAISTRQPDSKHEELAADIGNEVQRALRPLLAPLLAAIADLRHSIDRQQSPAPLSHAEMERLLSGIKNHLGEESLTATTADAHIAGPARTGWRLPRMRSGAT